MTRADTVAEEGQGTALKILNGYPASQRVLDPLHNRIDTADSIIMIRIRSSSWRYNMLHFSRYIETNDFVAC